MARYVFAVVDAGTALPRPELEAVDVGRLRAVARQVDVADYEGDQLQRNLEDAAWLEGAVREHQRTVESLLGAASAVVPMQFGSIFTAPGGLEAMLAANADDLGQLLDRVRGRQEWGVKLRVDVAAAARELVPASGASGGRAYLQRRKDEQEAAERVAVGAAAVADEVHGALRSTAADAALLAVRSGTGGGHLVLNGAYLVDVAELDRFTARLDELERSTGPAYRFDVSGPWPPYSFTTVDVTGPH